MKNIIVALLVTLISLNGANPPPLSEQFEYAAIVFTGTVSKQIFAVGDVEAVELVDVVYHKGSGPSKVMVRGFGIKTYGKLPMPKLESRVIIFGCDGDNNDFRVKLNDYAHFAGIRTVNDDVINDMKKFRIPNNSPSNRYRFETCKTEASARLPQGFYGFA